MVLRDVQFELLETATDFGNDMLTFEFQVNPVDSNKVQTALDPYDGDRDAHVVDHVLQHLVYVGVLPRLKLNRRIFEQLVAPLSDFALRDSCRILHIADGIMLIRHVIFHLLLDECMHLHFFVLHDLLEPLLQCSALFFFLKYDV